MASMALARITDFTPNTTIQSAQVDAEFNQLVNLLNGTSEDVEALLTLNAANPVLTLNQKGSGPILVLKDNSVEKSRFSGAGALQIGNSLTEAQIGTTLISLNSDANNTDGIVESIQTITGAGTGLRIAMEHSTSVPLTAIQVTKNISGIKNFFLVRNSGEVRTAAGYPDSMSNVPQGTNVTLGGQYKQTLTAVGNINTGEDDLHSHTIPAYVLAQDGDSLQCSFTGTWAANTNNKTLKLYFAGNLLFVADDTFNDGFWHIDFDITRIDADSILFSYLFGYQVASDVSPLASAIGGNFQVDSLDFTISNILKMTGQATATDDVVQKLSLIRKFARAQ